MGSNHIFDVPFEFVIYFAWILAYIGASCSRSARPGMSSFGSLKKLPGKGSFSGSKPVTYGLFAKRALVLSQYAINLSRRLSLFLYSDSNATIEFDVS